MAKKPLKLSIVIPVYNEERYLKACLDALAAQLVRVDEVIVVNNNSTDGSVKIAESYNFVKVIHEELQHQSYAQKKGFDAARGDIIARIDADTILPKHWSGEVKDSFSDPAVVAITGGTMPYDINFKRTARLIFNAYNQIASFIGGTRMLWGSNCAIRKSTWQKISKRVLRRKDIWEDYDLSFCIKGYGKIIRKRNIDVATSFRAIQRPLFTQIDYQSRAVRTFYLRANLLRTSILAIVWCSLIATIPFILLHQYVVFPLSKKYNR